MKLIGPKSRTKLDQAMRSRTCACFQGWSSLLAFRICADGVADRDQLADDAGMLVEDAVGDRPLRILTVTALAVDDLHQAPCACR